MIPDEETARPLITKPLLVAVTTLVFLGVYATLLADSTSFLLWGTLVAGPLVGTATILMMRRGGVLDFERLSNSRRSLWFALLSANFVYAYGAGVALFGWDQDVRRFGVTCVIGFTILGLWYAQKEHREI